MQTCKMLGRLLQQVHQRHLKFISMEVHTSMPAFPEVMLAQREKERAYLSIELWQAVHWWPLCKAASAGRGLQNDCHQHFSPAFVG
jgi:hypothetical protein